MTPPRLTLSNGAIEFLKWLALLLMTGDHINKYLLNGTNEFLFAAGRLALPLFAVVLGYNLARPGALASGAYVRVMKRLAVFGLAATPAFITLGGLAAGWWPLNVMFTLLVATAVLCLVDQGGKWHLAAAAAVFLLGGSSVEYWWPALTISGAVWLYCRRPAWPALLLLAVACWSLWFINGNLWALGALPVVAGASAIKVQFPRLQWAFYAFYPLHLSVLWLARIPMRKMGYLFFT